MLERTAEMGIMGRIRRSRKHLTFADTRSSNSLPSYNFDSIKLSKSWYSNLNVSRENEDHPMVHLAFPALSKEFYKKLGVNYSKNRNRKNEELETDVRSVRMKAYKIYSRCFIRKKK